MDGNPPTITPLAFFEGVHTGCRRADAQGSCEFCERIRHILEGVPQDLLALRAAWEANPEDDTAWLALGKAAADETLNMLMAGLMLAGWLYMPAKQPEGAPRPGTNSGKAIEFATLMFTKSLQSLGISAAFVPVTPDEDEDEDEDTPNEFPH